MTPELYDAGMDDDKPGEPTSPSSDSLGGPEPGSVGSADTPAGSEGPVGDIPPLGNTGGNSPKQEESNAFVYKLDGLPYDANAQTPGQVDVGWLKIRHTEASYAAWSRYRVKYKLADTAEDCPAGRNFRACGAKMHWGGVEYWGWKTGRDEAGERVNPDWCWEPWMLKLSQEEIEVMKANGVNISLPDPKSILTEWSDDALRYLDFKLQTEDFSLIKLLRELLALGATVTRLDLSVDFAGTVIEPVYDAMMAKDYKPMRVHDYRDSRGKPKGGRTCYFGQRGADGSGVFVRFYEKGKEQDLPIDLLRYEVELTGDKAQDAAKKLTANVQVWPMVAAGILATQIDFQDGYGAMRGTAHASRDCQRSAWWTLLLARLSAGVKLEHLKRPDPTFMSLYQWISKTWGRPGAMMRRWMGPTEFYLLLKQVFEDGEKKLTTRDLALLRDARECEVPF